MRHSSTAFLTLLATVVFSGSRSPVQAADNGGHASACKPLNGAHAAEIDFFSNGAFNISTINFRSITCGTLRATTAHPTVVEVDYYDAVSSNLVSCGLQVWQWGTPTQLFLQNAFSRNEEVGSGTFRFTIPSSIVGRVQITCNLPPATTATSGQSGIRGFRF